MFLVCATTFSTSTCEGSPLLRKGFMNGTIYCNMCFSMLTARCEYQQMQTQSSLSFLHLQYSKRHLCRSNTEGAP